MSRNISLKLNVLVGFRFQVSRESEEVKLKFLTNRISFPCTEISGKLKKNESSSLFSRRKNLFEQTDNEIKSRASRYSRNREYFQRCSTPSNRFWSTKPENAKGKSKFSIRFDEPFLQQRCTMILNRYSSIDEYFVREWRSTLGRTLDALTRRDFDENQSSWTHFQFSRFIIGIFDTSRWIRIIPSEERTSLGLTIRHDACAMTLKAEVEKRFCRSAKTDVDYELRLTESHRNVTCMRAELDFYRTRLIEISTI